jgi:hypothetical protein
MSAQGPADSDNGPFMSPALSFAADHNPVPIGETAGPPPSPGAGSSSRVGDCVRFVTAGSARGRPALMPSSGMLPPITILTAGASSARAPISRLSFASNSQTWGLGFPRAAWDSSGRR